MLWWHSAANDNMTSTKRSSSAAAQWTCNRTTAAQLTCAWVDSPFSSLIDHTRSEAAQPPHNSFDAAPDSAWTLAARAACWIDTMVQTKLCHGRKADAFFFQCVQDKLRDLEPIASVDLHNQLWMGSCLWPPPSTSSSLQRLGNFSPLLRLLLRQNDYNPRPRSTPGAVLHRQEEAGWAFTAASSWNHQLFLQRVWRGLGLGEGTTVTNKSLSVNERRERKQAGSQSLIWQLSAAFLLLSRL